MKSPLVDITTFNGIQSLFSGHTKDPWAYELAGKFADAYIYSENIRYAKPRLDEHYRKPHSEHEPSILFKLASRESKFFKAEDYSSKDPRELTDDYLEKSFDKFSSWVKNNPKTTKKWISLHNEKWIRKRRPLQNEGLIFSLDNITKSLEFRALARKIGTNKHELCHVFDVILRTPIYGELAGENELYLNHPLRSMFSLPTMEVVKASPPKISISLEETITNFVKKYSLTEEEYAIVLYELRGHIRDQSINKLSSGEIDVEILRKIAEKVKLPPRIKNPGKVAIAAAGALTALGALIGDSPTAAIVGASITVSPLIWKGYLPLSTSKIKWLSWALKYDIEKQAKERNG